MSLAAIAADLESAALVFCGEQLHVDLHGCLFWPRERLLVVSDLHLEKGSSFAARRGSFLPPYDTQATLEKLGHSVSFWQPKTIVSLGDSFHDGQASSRLPARFRQGLLQLMAGREWIWVSGNHDPEPPENLGGMFCGDLHLGPLNFTHEPESRFTEGEIAGHLHPAAKIRQRGKTVRRRCLVSDGRRLILPAFGAFTGGLNIRDRAYDALFRQDALEAFMLGRDRVYRIDGRKLVA